MSWQKPERRLDDAIPVELRGWEAELAAIRPRADSLDRDRLMFEAGRASVAPARLRFAWPAATAAMATLAACLAVVVFLQPAPRVVERVRVVEVEREPQSEPKPEQEIAPAPNPQPQSAPPAVIGSTQFPGAPSMMPRAGAEFRLFEHLMGQQAMPLEAAAPVQAEEPKQERLSPRSLPNLLDYSAMSADGDQFDFRSS